MSEGKNHSKECSQRHFGKFAKEAVSAQASSFFASRASPAKEAKHNAIKTEPVKFTTLKLIYSLQQIMIGIIYFPIFPNPADFSFQILIVAMFFLFLILHPSAVGARSIFDVFISNLFLLYVFINVKLFFLVLL